jgi:hypothetical protein
MRRMRAGVYRAGVWRSGVWRSGVLRSGIVALCAVASTPSVAAAPMPSPVQTPAPTLGVAGTPQNLRVIVSGCIQRESDYRRAREGSSAVAVIGNEGDVVLVNAVVTVTGSQIAGSSAQAPDDQPAATPESVPLSEPSATTPPATTPPATTGVAYQLIGSRESEAAALVGRLVEITGSLSDVPVTELAPAPLAGRDPQVTDVTVRGLHLRQLDVDSVRTLSDTCAAQ